MAAERVDAVVIGAGPAGLATGHELRRAGVPHVILERGEGVGHTWANLYDSLTLHTGKHMSALPGRPLPRSAPTFVPRASFVEYLRDYASTLELPVRTRTAVTRADHGDHGWQLETSNGELHARALVIATGIVSNPRAPYIAGQDGFRGEILHSVEYRRPDPFAGAVDDPRQGDRNDLADRQKKRRRRVLVVGVGNSGAEIASELARAGVEVTIAVRSGANVVPRALFGVPIQYLSFWVRKLPRPAQEAIVAAMGRLTAVRRGAPVLPRPAHSPLDAIPVIGFALVDAIRAGQVTVKGGIDAFTEDGVRFLDGTSAPFDTVILATGYAPALQPLRHLVRVDARGFAMRSDRVSSADLPDLYFVGHNYDATGGLYNIRLDAPVVAERIARTGGHGSGSSGRSA